MAERDTIVEKLSRLLERKDLRSADRANMVTMLKKLRKGHDLSYQERQNLWALQPLRRRDRLIQPSVIHSEAKAIVKCRF